MELSTGWIVFVVYLMGQVDIVVNLMGFMLGLSVVFSIICAVVSGFWAEDNRKSYSESFFGQHYKKFLVVAIILSGFMACTPRSDSIKHIAIAAGASEVLQSDAAKNVATEISKIAGKTADVVNKKLDKALEEK